MLTNIYKNWFEKGIDKDPKLESFKKIIKEQIKTDPKRKIIVFTEFTDTLEYLYDKLNEDKELRIFKYSSQDATQENRNIIKRNFDASVERHAQLDDYDILLSTDAISEGYNLNRAGTVFNYDIPYNPVRVIQRVGRINRINLRRFKELYIYNFFPTLTGEREVGVRGISTLKIAIISALLGSDTRVLTADEEISSHFLNSIKKRLKETEEESWDVKYDNLINDLRNNDPNGILKQAREIPLRTKIGRKSNNKKGLLIFAKKGKESVFKFTSNAKENITLSSEDAIKLFEADMSETATEVSEKFEELYQYLKQNLYLTKKQVLLVPGERQSIQKLNLLKRQFSSKEYYFKDLIRVIRNYGSLPEIYARKLRAVDISEEGINTLMKIIPESYISRMLGRIKKIADEEEILILSEELQ